MKLLTSSIRKALPPLYKTEAESDPPAYAKFFTPWSNWTWYATEFDGRDICFGFIVGTTPELGYFSLSEIEAIRGPAGLTIERDIHFSPTSLSQIRKIHNLEKAS